MKILLLFLPVLMFVSCKKTDTSPIVNPPPPPPGVNENFSYVSTAINGVATLPFKNISRTPAVRVRFSVPISRTSAAQKIMITELNGATVGSSVNFDNGDSTVLISPQTGLQFLTRYKIKIDAGLRSAKNTALNTANEIGFYTTLDSSRKFPAISDNALLDLVQQQTLKYFYDFGHPVSGLARERNTSGDLVTSGGSGFGIMAMIAGVSRNFITKPQGFSRIQTMVGFLRNTAQTFHGAFPHWLNGATGAVIPFSPNDNGADLVETAFLAEGLICARQYFSGTDAAETALRADINFILNRIEWNWFRQGAQNVLTWHWSPNLGFVINQQIRGWNETLMTYVLAKSSTTYTIPASVYTNGWAFNGTAPFTNGNTYYGLQLPLGPNLGGPLFFEHYSFLGINPNGLTDAYANYATQTKNHTLINYNYCKANPQNYYGYSDSCWGLTASDIPNGGYTASSPTNDVGVIAPTAALSSFPYPPTESMKAMKFFYYVLGDKIWKQYGFVDAFKLDDPWFADSFLAIDQGPIIVNIENFRSGLLWNLFTSAPEVKAGMRTLGFNAPYL